MKSLSRREEQVLLAIWNLKEEAYLMSIMKYLSKITAMDWSLGVVQKPLIQLEKKQFIRSNMGEATPTRGGRRKKMYEITSRGKEALKSVRKEQDVLWEDFLNAEFERLT